MEVNSEAVRAVFINVLEGKMTREEADRWAFSIVTMAESKKHLVFIPLQDQKKIWDGVMYLYGIDLMEKPGVYLHTQEDIQSAFEKIFIKHI